MGRHGTRRKWCDFGDDPHSFIDSLPLRCFTACPHCLHVDILHVAAEWTKRSTCRLSYNCSQSHPSQAWRLKRVSRLFITRTSHAEHAVDHSHEISSFQHGLYSVLCLVLTLAQCTYTYTLDRGETNTWLGCGWCVHLAYMYTGSSTASAFRCGRVWREPLHQHLRLPVTRSLPHSQGRCRALLRQHGFQARSLTLWLLGICTIFVLVTVIVIGAHRFLLPRGTFTLIVWVSKLFCF